MPPTQRGETPTAPGIPTSIASPDMRRAGRDLLSLALIDARNLTLHRLALYESALAQAGLAQVPQTEGVVPPHWLAGYVGWFAEWWIARNTQRAFGRDCPVRPTRLASIEPMADAWWNPANLSLGERWSPAVPDAEQTRAYLLETLEATLELLDKAAPTDAGLYFYRLALLHEDLLGEQLVVMAQTVGLPLDIEMPQVPALREPLTVPAARWTLGQGDARGLLFAQETGRLAVDVPEFEIDAQPVSWQQYVEFVEDGGYDRSELWSAAGVAWLDASARRAPRHVEQIGAGGSLVLRQFDRTLRGARHHSAVHLSWWEAQAWARWAGRRLATEVEWEMAAHVAAGRGFRWGDVHEWTAGTLHAWPGFCADPWSAGTPFDPQPAFARERVVRGASFATAPRLRAPTWRGFAPPSRDDAFIGFRTCAV